MKARTRFEFEAWKKIEPFIGVGITIRKCGIGDGLQFSSLPENFYMRTGQELIDVSQPWFFDHNPYVIRDPEIKAKRTVELWNYPKIYDWPSMREKVFLSNAEIHAGVLGVFNPPMIYPRLYKFEDFPFQERKKILFHPFGKSHGSLPDQVIDHILKKYDCPDLYQIGLDSEPSIGIPRISTNNVWELAKVISECRMLIGIDSGPTWIAACYPDVVAKKIRTKFQFGYCEPKDWVPLDVKNSHSFWDDLTLFDIYNCYEEDVGFTKSYRRI